MPNINIAISDELLKAIRMACAESGKSQKQLVTECLERTYAVKAPYLAINAAGYTYAVEADTAKALAPVVGETCKHGFPTCFMCNFKDGVSL